MQRGAVAETAVLEEEEEEEEKKKKEEEEDEEEEESLEASWARLQASRSAVRLDVGYDMT